MGSGMEDIFARSSYAAPDRIVVATALSDLEYLAPQAVAQAEAARAELVFVHAIAPGVPPAQATFYNPLKADRDARLTLEVLARHVRARNIACTTAVRHGQPTEVVEELLRQRSAGRLIIGTRATTDAPQDSLGTTAGELLLQTPVPVCALPPQPAEASTARAAARRAPVGLGQGSIEAPRAILYPVGNQGPHPEGMRFALDLAHYLHSELVVLQVSSPGTAADDRLPIPCSASLRPRMRRIRRPDASVASVLDAVRETGAGMLLTEAPPSLAGGQAVPATLAELVAQAPCPVLTFPVLPWNRNHPDLHILSGAHDGSTALSAFETL